MAETRNTEPVLSVRDLVTEINGRPVVDGVSFDVKPAEVVALVGESGSGKSITAFSIMGLLPAAARATAGQVEFGGRNLLGLTESAMRAVRGESMSMIFQEPISSLNPLMKVGAQVAESLIVHGKASPEEAGKAAIDMLRQVGIPEPEERAKQLPAELSGGMCQRVMIASALISKPKLLIADEPTTALDVTIQAQILSLMKDLRGQGNTAILLITHDMGVVADIADRVCVMYGGRIVETGEVHEIFARPSHPYTRLLLGTIPKLTGDRKRELRSIEGTVPDVNEWPDGCRFRTRCPLAEDDCAHLPPVTAIGGQDSHWAACWHLDRVETMA